MNAQQKRDAKIAETKNLFKEVGVNWDHVNKHLTLIAYAVAVIKEQTATINRNLVTAGLTGMPKNMRLNQLLLTADIITKQNIDIQSEHGKQEFADTATFLNQFIELALNINEPLDRLKAVSTMKLFVKPTKK